MYTSAEDVETIIEKTTREHNGARNISKVHDTERDFRMY